MTVKNDLWEMKNSVGPVIAQAYCLRSLRVVLQEGRSVAESSRILEWRDETRSLLQSAWSMGKKQNDQICRDTKCTPLSTLHCQSCVTSANMRRDFLRSGKEPPKGITGSDAWSLYRLEPLLISYYEKNLIIWNTQKCHFNIGAVFALG